MTDNALPHRRLLAPSASPPDTSLAPMSSASDATGASYGSTATAHERLPHPAVVPPSDPPSGIQRRLLPSALDARFSALAAAELRRLYKRIRRHGRWRRTTALDVPWFALQEWTQQALVKLWEKIDTVPPEHWRSWMRGALEIEARRWRRASFFKARFEPQIAVQEEARLAPTSPEEHRHQRECERDLEELLADLDGAQHTVARLHLVEGLSLQEIAENMNRKAGTVRMWWWRARAKMAAAWRRKHANDRRGPVALLLALFSVVWSRLFRGGRPRPGALVASAALVAFIGPHDVLDRAASPGDALAVLAAVSGDMRSGPGVGTPTPEVDGPGAVSFDHGAMPTASDAPNAPLPETTTATRPGSAAGATTATRPGSVAGAARSARALSTAEKAEADRLLRLATTTALTDPARAVRLALDHERRFGDHHASVRADVLRTARWSLARAVEPRPESHPGRAP